ncbi:SGNH/GDSL hydrolase family protein [Alkalibaculum sp. M08DMB]|uniref:SGNH/GDSL hydrolase family protein n=1 Tax=Alkalibaculum sporogenes TaxID=2655001 RepID=A0A6A7KBM9_9FIRM|nr:SGNH/GDSL hydrolase family protein [Alkalibaculum sporogenes]MPW26755.1 SGNH/GDSL hydrolase family protein [Alkalibaculum sporogenes]
MKTKRVLISFVMACLLLGSLFLMERLLMPKYVSGVVEGSLIEEYYSESGKHDVIFIGDCEVYENISPITLWEEYGIASYIRGSAQQLIWQSYYLLEETLKYEKPEVVVFNVLAMKYDQPQNEAYNRMTLDGMKMSPTKLKSINASMLEEESLIDYLFPLLRYHSRWSEVTKSDFQNIFKKEKQFHNGYYMRADVKPVESIPKGRKLPDYQFGDNAYYYLNSMVELCKENDIELILIKAPSLYPYWYDEWEFQMEKYANKHDLQYINFLELIDEVGIDFNTDTYDAGLHLNVAGAEKLSKYFGKILREEYQIVDKRNNYDYVDIWKEKITFYNDIKETQYAEIDKYGSLQSFGGNGE